MKVTRFDDALFILATPNNIESTLFSIIKLKRKNRKNSQTNFVTLMMLNWRKITKAAVNMNMTFNKIFRLFNFILAWFGMSLVLNASTSSKFFDGFIPTSSKYSDKRIKKRAPLDFQKWKKVTKQRHILFDQKIDLTSMSIDCVRVIIEREKKTVYCVYMWTMHAMSCNFPKNDSAWWIQWRKLRTTPHIVYDEIECLSIQSKIYMLAALLIWLLLLLL